jgi:broad specificity phosphatase PhoE
MMRRLRESPTGTKRVTFLRHGESLHKVVADASGRACHCDDLDAATRTQVGCPYRDAQLIDSALTPRGHELVRGIGVRENVQVVLASTSVRTLETAFDAFPGVPIVALESLRSRVSGHMHTKRKRLSELARMFPNVTWPRDVDDEDSLWDGDTESRASMDARMQTFIAELLDRAEERIAVVTHFTVFLALLARNSDPRVLGTNAARSRDDDPWLILDDTTTTIWNAGELRTITLRE